MARRREEIQTGRGFQVISGVPVAEWSEADASLCFWCLGRTWAGPARRTRRAICSVTCATRCRRDYPFVRLDRTAANIADHCDAADVVGLRV